MERTEFINLIGTKTLVDYPAGREIQLWSLENFTYDKANDLIAHNRLPLILEVFIANACNPHPGSKSEATHG